MAKERVDGTEENRSQGGEAHPPEPILVNIEGGGSHGPIVMMPVVTLAEYVDQSYTRGYQAALDLLNRGLEHQTKQEVAKERLSGYFRSLSTTFAENTKRADELSKQKKKKKGVKEKVTPGIDPLDRIC